MKEGVFTKEKARALRKQLNEKLQEEYKNGKISREVYEATKTGGRGVPAATDGQGGRASRRRAKVSRPTTKMMGNPFIQFLVVFSVLFAIGSILYFLGDNDSAMFFACDQFGCDMP